MQFTINDTVFQKYINRMAKAFPVEMKAAVRRSTSSMKQEVMKETPIGKDPKVSRAWRKQWGKFHKPGHGHLRRSIASKISDGGWRGEVFPTLSYALPVHEGTNSHFIVAKNKKALFWGGAAHPFKKVHHPGTKPNPFIRRAFENNSGEIKLIFRRFLESALKK